MPETPPSEPTMLFPQSLLQEVSGHLRQHQGEWRTLGISRVQVFGSVARNDADDASDVDVLVEFAAPAGLIAQVRAAWLFERLLGRRTDVVTAGALKLPLRQAVLEDAVDVLGPILPTETRLSPKRWRWRVQELIGLLERLAALARDQNLLGFSADTARQDAACMNLLRLGEGTKFVPQALQDAHPELPWAELRGLRNLLAHDYFGLDVELLWHTLSAELPPLKAKLEAVLESMEETV